MVTRSVSVHRYPYFLLKLVWSVAVGMPLFARELERDHGRELSRPPFSEVRSPYLLFRALQERRPPIDTTRQAVKTWWQTYRSTSGMRIGSAEELEEKHGADLRDLVFCSVLVAAQMSRGLTNRSA